MLRRLVRLFVVFYYATCNGWGLVPDSGNECPLEGLKRTRPDDGLYQAETGRLKKLYSNILYDPVLKFVFVFD